MLSSRFLWQLWAALAGMVVVATIVFGVFLAGRHEQDLRSQITDSLLDQTILLRPRLLPHLKIGERIPAEILEQLTSGLKNRITVIRPNGVVLADNRENPEAMDDHSTRPEVISALRKGFGVSERFSDTLNEDMLYVALRLEDSEGVAGYLRLAMPLSSVQGKIVDLRVQVLVSALVIAAVFLLVGYGLAIRITQPLRNLTQTAEQIAKGQYDLRLPDDRHDEIGTLSTAMNRLARETEARILDLTGNRNQLAAVLSGLTEGVIAVDWQGNILHVNDSAAQMMRVPRSEIYSSGLRGMSYASEIMDAIETCLQQRIVVHAAVQFAETSLDISVAPLSDFDSTKPVGAIAVLADITEVLRLEKVRSDFVANASHELKTPISAIRGLVETILDDEEMEKETLVRFLSRISSQALRLDNIVQDLLRLSRFDTRDREIETRKINLSELLRRVYDAKVEDATDAGVELSLQVAEGDVHVEGEVEAIDQMVINLVDNAIKYSDGDRGKVALRLLRQGRNVLVEVQDNGEGIPHDEQQRVFERFYRVDRGRSRELGGTGLGLSIVKHIARSHRGEVSLESEVGRGSLFSVRLPLADTTSSDSNSFLEPH